MELNKYEMILCIVNAGFSSNVMDAAKAVGAKGGTIIHGRGTANAEAEEFFRITIQPEKDIVMMIVDKNIKDDVLHVGLKTAGQGIAFSVPVNAAIGLNKTNSTEKTDKSA